MGEYDLVKILLDKLGAMEWMQIAIKPAKPFAFGIVRRGDVRSDIEQTAHAVDDGGQRLHVCEMDGDAEVLLLRLIRDRDEDPAHHDRGDK